MLMAVSWEKQDNECISPTATDAMSQFGKLQHPQGFRCHGLAEAELWFRLIQILNRYKTMPSRGISMERAV